MCSKQLLTLNATHSYPSLSRLLREQIPQRQISPAEPYQVVWGRESLRVGRDCHLLDKTDLHTSDVRQKIVCLGL